MTTANGSPNVDRPGAFKHILCPVDLSEISPSVVAHAIALARWHHADVTVVHVFGVRKPPASLAAYPDWAREVPESRESITGRLQALLEPFASHAVALTLRTAEGDAATEIMRHADEMSADLIVMGTHGRSGFDRLALGSVTEKVLRKASCPVLTLSPDAARSADAVEYRHILCPTDFSEPSRDVLKLALCLAHSANADLTVLHVVDTIGGDSTPADAPPYVTVVRANQRHGAEHFLHEIVATHAGAGGNVKEAVVFGEPYREILRMAVDRNVDAIVMGVRRRGAMDLTLFGSTTNQVVRRATCPVITLRGR